jgi:hypothetical protein
LASCWLLCVLVQVLLLLAAAAPAAGWVTAATAQASQFV